MTSLESSMDLTVPVVAWLACDDDFVVVCPEPAGAAKPLVDVAARAAVRMPAARMMRMFVFLLKPLCGIGLEAPEASMSGRLIRVHPQREAASLTSERAEPDRFRLAGLFQTEPVVVYVHQGRARSTTGAALERGGRSCE